MAKKYIGIIVWLLVALAVVIFIFANSIAGIEASGDFSSGFAEVLYKLASRVVSLSFDEFHVLVRKVAHFTEFAALGASVWMIMWNAKKLCGKLHIAVTFLVSLAVAVTDEFIQSFTGRGSAVPDVVLDFAGSVFGTLVTAVIVYLIKTKKQPSKPM